jgi:hypothetical protein
MVLVQVCSVTLELQYVTYKISAAKLYSQYKPDAENVES